MPSRPTLSPSAAGAASADPAPLLPDFAVWLKHGHPRGLDTRSYLDANPLPLDFLWPDDTGHARPVRPRHATVTSYGKWLEETPYFPGLFEEIHGILLHARDLGDATWLAAELLRRRPPLQSDLPLL